MSACAGNGSIANQGAYDGFDDRVVEIVGIDHPTNFSVDVRDVEGGPVYRNVARSRTCANAKALKIGQRHRARFDVYLMADQSMKVRINDRSFNAKLCDTTRVLALAPHSSDGEIPLRYGHNESRFNGGKYLGRRADCKPLI